MKIITNKNTLLGFGEKNSTNEHEMIEIKQIVFILREID